MKKLLLLLILPFLLSATTITMKSTESIMQKMISVNPGDTLLLEPGEYNESIIVSNKVTLMGKSPYTTKLLGNGRGNVVELKTGSTIQGVTIAKGGIGIFSEGRNITVKECIITQNLRNGLMAVKSLPLIENSVLISNSGYGIHATGIALVPKETLLNITITKNGKGGIYFDGTVPFSLMESVISKNGIKEITFKNKKPLISQTIINPMSKDFEKDNLHIKPTFRALRGKKKDYRIVSTLGTKGVIFTTN